MLLTILRLIYIVEAEFWPFDPNITDDIEVKKADNSKNVKNTTTLELGLLDQILNNFRYWGWWHEKRAIQICGDETDG